MKKKIGERKQDHGVWEGGGGVLNINGVIDKVYKYCCFPAVKKNLGVEIFRVSLGGACYICMKERRKREKKL